MPSLKGGTDVRQVRVFGIARPMCYMVLENKCVPMLEHSVMEFSHLSLMHEGRIIAGRSIVQTQTSSWVSAGRSRAKTHKL
jgi:hypothetical protein